MIEFELIDDSQTIDVNLIDDTEAIEVGIIKEIDKYPDLKELPSINDVTLIGNKTLNELGIQPEGDYLTEETDPTVPNYVKNITQNDITNWNNKADESDIPDVSSFITKDVNNLTNYTLKTNTGSLIDLEIDTTDYIVTLSLKNQDGTVISTDSIDLPLESVVVSGRYDNNTKKVILTLENGSEVDFSVADLVSGLQTELSSSNKLNADYVDDTNSGNKFVTTSEKTTWNNKLDSSALTNYVTKTNYATNGTGGVIKIDTSYNGINIGSSGFLFPSSINYETYTSKENNYFIGKGTLENVVAGKGLDLKQLSTYDATKTQVLKNINGTLTWVDES